MKATNLMPTSLEEILFKVEIKENPRATNNEYSKVVTGIIDNKEIDLNYCSPKYTLVPNSKIFPSIRQILLDKGINFSETYSHIDNARFYGSYILHDDKFIHRVNGSNDMIKPIINIQHSYNGKTNYKIQFGYFRLVCSNGLVIPVEEMKEYNLSIVGKHTESILNSI